MAEDYNTSTARKKKGSDVDPRAGVTLADLLKFKTGSNNPTTDKFRQAMREDGYKESDIRKMSRALDRINSTEGLSLKDFIIQDDGYDIVNKTGSGRAKGNVKGFDMGDLIGLGNSVSMLAGTLGLEKGALEKMRNREITSKEREAAPVVTKPDLTIDQTMKAIRDRQKQLQDNATDNVTKGKGGYDGPVGNLPSYLYPGAPTKPRDYNPLNPTQGMSQQAIDRIPEKMNELNVQDILSMSDEDIDKMIRAGAPTHYGTSPFAINLKNFGINTEGIENTLLGGLLFNEGSIDVSPVGASGGVGPFVSKVLPNRIYQQGAGNTGVLTWDAVKGASGGMRKALDNLLVKLDRYALRDLTSAEEKILRPIINRFRTRIPKARRIPQSASPTYGPAGEGQFTFK